MLCISPCVNYDRVGLSQIERCKLGTYRKWGPQHLAVIVAQLPKITELLFLLTSLKMSALLLLVLKKKCCFRCLVWPGCFVFKKCLHACGRGTRFDASIIIDLILFMSVRIFTMKHCKEFFQFLLPASCFVSWLQKSNSLSLQTDRIWSPAWLPSHFVWREDAQTDGKCGLILHTSRSENSYIIDYDHRKRRQSSSYYHRMSFPWHTGQYCL